MTRYHNYKGEEVHAMDLLVLEVPCALPAASQMLLARSGFIWERVIRVSINCNCDCGEECFSTRVCRLFRFVVDYLVFFKCGFF